MVEFKIMESVFFVYRQLNNEEIYKPNFVEIVISLCNYTRWLNNEGLNLANLILIKKLVEIAVITRWTNNEEIYRLCC